MQNVTVKKKQRVLCVLGVRTLSYLQGLIGDTHRSETACHRGGRHLEHQSHNEWMGSDWLVVICCKSFSEFEKVTKKNTSNWSCWCWKISNAIIDAKCDRKEKTTWRLLIWRQKKSTKIYMHLLFYGETTLIGSCIFFLHFHVLLAENNTLCFADRRC